MPKRKRGAGGEPPETCFIASTKHWRQGAGGANAIALIVPCHRVIGADGSLTGFAFGTETKRRLLAHEGVEPWATQPA